MSKKNFRKRKPRKHHRKTDLADSRTNTRRKRSRETTRYRKRSSPRTMSTTRRTCTFWRTLPSIINQELFLRHL